MSESSFFSRWSKRKAGLEPDAGAPPAEQAAAPSEPGKSSLRPQDASAPAVAEANGAPAVGETPLPDIETLNGASDFSPFMAKNVPAEARNQAMKKLFADPHYNVMDGLDIYIDDYGKPDPLPAGWLELMNQSKSLRLFETPEEESVRMVKEGHPVARRTTDQDAMGALPAANATMQTTSEDALRPQAADVSGEDGAPASTSAIDQSS